MRVLKRPIVFIHGFGGGSYEYWPIRRFLQKKGMTSCYEFSYTEKIGQVSLKKTAWQLNAFLQSLPDPEFDIVALSQGGIIARLAIAHLIGKKIRMCVTVCTPHHGSLLAYVGFLPGIRELRPGSPLFQELDTSRAKYYAVWNPLDMMVIPGSSAKFEYAQENKKVVALLHPLTFSHPETLKFIFEKLSR